MMMTTARQMKVVIFSLGGKDLGVEVSCVHEVTGLMDITVVHEPSGLIKGVVNLRGQIITVVDLARQLEFSHADNVSKTAKLVFIEIKKKIFGIIVDQVSDVVNVSLEHAEASSDNVAGVVQPQYIQGIGRTDQRSIAVLDMEKILLKFWKG